jgi:hypothetical protein
VKNEKMTEELRRDLTKAAKDALQIQGACNLSGVVHSWSAAVSLLWRVNNVVVPLTGGTHWVNPHPINVLFAAKCASLTDIYWGMAAHGSERVFYDALAYCEAMVKDPSSTPVDYRCFGKEGE